MSKFAREFTKQYIDTGRLKGITKIKQADQNISKILNKDKEKVRAKKIKDDIQRMLRKEHGIL